MNSKLGSAILHEPSGGCRKMLFRASVALTCVFSRVIARKRAATRYGAITVADENLKQSEQAT